MKGGRRVEMKARPFGKEIMASDVFFSSFFSAPPSLGRKWRRTWTCATLKRADAFEGDFAGCFSGAD